MKCVSLTASCEGIAQVEYERASLACRARRVEDDPVEQVDLPMEVGLARATQMKKVRNLSMQKKSGNINNNSHQPDHCMFSRDPLWNFTLSLGGISQVILSIEKENTYTSYIWKLYESYFPNSEIWNSIDHTMAPWGHSILALFGTSCLDSGHCGCCGGWC